MAAIPKSRKTWSEIGQALNLHTLQESGNQISLNQRIILYAGKDPSFTPAENGLINDAFTTLKVTLASFVASGIAKGSIVNIYDKNFPVDPVTVHRNCVAGFTFVDSLTNVLLTFAKPLPNVGGNVTIARELCFYFSDRNCYMVDEFDVSRFFSNKAETSEIENDMGELFDYEFKTGDYRFTVSNYDNKFDIYQPGSQKSISWGGRLVQIYIGCGEERIKNRMVWEGITKFDSGLSEDNKKMQINAYHISYVYNKELNPARFKNVLDKDYENKPVPIILGNFITSPMKIATKSYPMIPAVLVKKNLVAHPAYCKILSSDTRDDAFVITSKLTGVSGNGYTITVNLYDYIQSSTWTKTGAFTYNGGTKTLVINCYAGKDTSGVLYSSTQYIRDLIVGDTTLNSLFLCTGHKNKPLREFYSIINHNTTHPQYQTQSAPSTTPKEYIQSLTSGGGSTQNAEYKISSNKLNNQLGQTGYFCKGSPDEEQNWQTAPWQIGGNSLTVDWDHQNGRVLVSNILGGTVIEDYKLFVAVEATSQVVSRNEIGSNLLLNIPHNETYKYSNRTAEAVSSRVDPFGIPPLAGVEPRAGFVLGSAFKFFPMQSVLYNNKVLYTSYSTERHVFKPEELRHDENFILEYEYSPFLPTQPFPQVGPITPGYEMDDKYNYRRLPNLRQCLLALSNDSKKVLELLVENNYVAVYFNGRTKKVRADNSQLVPNTNYKIRVQKISGVIKIFIKNLDTNSAFNEVAYETQNSWVSGDNATVYNAEVGFSKSDNNISSPKNWNWAWGWAGTIRFANDLSTITPSEWYDADRISSSTSPVAIARRLLEMGGTPSWRFDETFTEYINNSPINYSARFYSAKENVRCVETAHEFLAQFGFVLTMKSVDNIMKFSVIFDSVEAYRLDPNMLILADNDIVRDSVSTDREINKYFNITSAEYNLAPALDEFNYTSLPFYEPKAIERDAGVQYWYRVEEKQKFSFELPDVYLSTDVDARLKDALAIATPDTEMVSLTASFRFLFLNIGDFIYLNWDRYKMVPCQVRAVKVDASSSTVELKLMSLENVKYKDRINQSEHIPLYWDGVGGYSQKATITNYSNNDDV